jgi:hypothetical protein
VQRLVAMDVGPAVPPVRLDLPEQIARTEYMTAAALVVAVVGREQTAVRREGEPERVAQPPRDQLGLASLGRDAQNGAVARDRAGDHLSLAGRTAQRRKCAGGDTLTRRQGIRGCEVPTGQGDVAARPIVEVWEALQPAKLGVVLADHRRIACGALPEIEPSVGANDRAVCVMVAAAW